MLSYQHIYHAGNLADVHKHAALAWVLDYLARKDKPLSYLETHAGRGLYALDAAEAVKTGEAAAGIGVAEAWFGPDHPYRRALDAVRAGHGPRAYPGSPLLAATLLRPADALRLAELHPREHAALAALLGARATIERRDGFEMARAACPPDPRRGLLLVDPSYELKADYERIAAFLAGIHRKWNVGVLVLWYPILADARHGAMIAALRAAVPGTLVSEVRFPPARPGHGMTGSGLAVINAPWGMAEELARIEALFSTRQTGG